MARKTEKGGKFRMSTVGRGIWHTGSLEAELFTVTGSAKKPPPPGIATVTPALPDEAATVMPISDEPAATVMESPPEAAPAPLQNGQPEYLSPS